jgi:hypothetical protein
MDVGAAKAHVACNQQIRRRWSGTLGLGGVGVYRTGFCPMVRRFACQWCSWSRMKHLCVSPFVKV